MKSWWRGGLWSAGSFAEPRRPERAGAGSNRQRRLFHGGAVENEPLWFWLCQVRMT